MVGVLVATAAAVGTTADRRADSLPRVGAVSAGARRLVLRAVAVDTGTGAAGHLQCTGDGRGRRLVRLGEVVTPARGTAAGVVWERSGRPSLARVDVQARSAAG